MGRAGRYPVVCREEGECESAVNPIRAARWARDREGYCGAMAGLRDALISPAIGIVFRLHMLQAVLGARSITLVEAQQHHSPSWPSKREQCHGEGPKELEGPSAVQQSAWLSITLCSPGQLGGFHSASPSEFPLAKDEADSAAMGCQQHLCAPQNISSRRQRSTRPSLLCK